MRRKSACVCLLPAVASLLCLSLRAQGERWEELKARVEELHQQAKYAEAIPVAEEALHIAEATFGPEHTNVAASLNSLAELYRAQGDYARAEPLYLRALNIREKALGADHPDIAESLNNLAELYRGQGNYAQAEPLYQRALSIVEQARGPAHGEVAVVLNNLGLLYIAQGNYAAAEPVLQRALRISEDTYGPDHREVATALNSLAQLYLRQGKYAQAEPLSRRTLATLEKLLGPEHPETSTALLNLGYVLTYQGKYGESEPLLRRSLAIFEKSVGSDHLMLTPALSALAQTLFYQGRHAEAEPLYERALAIKEKNLGKDHPDVAADLNNLAMLYEEEGKYAQGVPIQQRAVEILETVLGAEHPHVAITVANLARLYMRLGRYPEAEPLYQRALGILEKAVGSEHPYVGVMSSHLGRSSEAQGRLPEAEGHYGRALAINEKALGAHHPYVGLNLLALGRVSRIQGKLAEAELLLNRARQLLEGAVGAEHADVGRTLSESALLYYARDLPKQAEPLFVRTLQNVARQFQQHFTFMSEKERLGFFDTVADAFPAYFSFCFHYREQEPQLVGQMYDVVLWQKGFIGQSIAALRAQIAASGDPEAFRLLEELTAKKTQLAKLLQTTPEKPEEWRKQVEQLEREANELERELVKRSAALAEQKQLAGVTWRDVQKALRPGEAAVEFLRFRHHNGKQWTDKTYYVALIVTPETTTAPVLVVLGEGEQLEGAPLRDYQGLVSPDGAAAPSGLYASLWQPLEPALKKAKRVYLAPDGALNLIAWGVIPLDQKRRLVDRYDLHVVSSTKDLLRAPRGALSNAAVLIGNPRFNLEESKQRAAAESFQQAEEEKPPLAALVRGSRSRDQQGELLPPLSGAKAELDTLEALLRQHHWRVELYSEDSALEEAIKGVQRPRVLHVATHGFFLSDQQVAQHDLPRELPSGREDPMLRSGLYFAGAERTLAGQPLPADLDDGILTAYEASGLNLQGTELVVLSACETGLGQVKNGEGVFGLRRALQVAGAEAVLMSLWAVPDRETQELMTLFYQNWLGGQPKHEALRSAQKQLRARIRQRYGRDLPYYWGAFILVGAEPRP